MKTNFSKHDDSESIIFVNDIPKSQDPLIIELRALRKELSDQGVDDKIQVRIFDLFRKFHQRGFKKTTVEVIIITAFISSAASAAITYYITDHFSNSSTTVEHK